MSGIVAVTVIISKKIYFFNIVKNSLSVDSNNRPDLESIEASQQLEVL